MVYKPTIFLIVSAHRPFRTRAFTGYVLFPHSRHLDKTTSVYAMNIRAMIYHLAHTRAVMFRFLTPRLSTQLEGTGCSNRLLRVAMLSCPFAQLGKCEPLAKHTHTRVRGSPAQCLSLRPPHKKLDFFHAWSRCRSLRRNRGTGRWRKVTKIAPAGCAARKRTAD